MNAPDIHAGSDRDRAEALVRLLDVAPAGERQFEGRRKHGGVGRIFGGEVVAQALAAACKTVEPDRKVHSLHAYFLRGGNEKHPARYQVEADFDGGSFSNRRVIASQQGEIILNLAASFHIEEPGRHHQVAMPDVSGPESLPDMAEMVRRYRASGQADTQRLRFLERPWPMELRGAGALPMLHVEPMEPVLSYWFRMSAPVDAPQWMHRALLAFASDLGVLSSAALPHGDFRMQGASIDHSLWFHGDVHVDDWLLYHLESPWSGNGRGFGLGKVFDREGRLVASVAQEGLMRDLAMRGS